MSFQYLVGAEIDYQEGGRFAVCHQESECHNYLRLRFFILGITSRSAAGKATGAQRPVCIYLG